nr:MAG TPA: hypothetical protein [Caudoviricetes sp.]
MSNEVLINENNMVMQDWLSCILVWLTYHKIFSYTKIHEMSIWLRSYTHFNIKKIRMYSSEYILSYYLLQN